MSGTNSTIECLKSRRSVKSYKPDMLPKEVIQEMYPGLSKGRSTGNPSKKRKLDILCRLMGYRRSLWSSRN